MKSEPRKYKGWGLSPAEIAEVPPLPIRYKGWGVFNEDSLTPGSLVYHLFVYRDDQTVKQLSTSSQNTDIRKALEGEAERVIANFRKENPLSNYRMQWDD